MLNHDKPPASRDQRSSQTTPLTDEEDRPYNDQGWGDSKSGQVAVQFHGFGCGDETGGEDPRGLDLRRQAGDFYGSKRGDRGRRKLNKFAIVATRMGIEK